MAKTVDNLRGMVVDIVKVKANTDPTKTQGIRLRQLLNDILDTVEDLVEKQGLAVYSDVMQELNTMQDVAIQNLRDEVHALIEAIPDHSIYALNTDVKEKLGYYVLTDTLNDILNKYEKIADSFSGSYNDLRDKPSIPVLPDLSTYAKKTDIPASADLSVYALKSSIPTIPTYDFSIYQKTTDTIPYSRLSGTPTIPTIPVYDFSIYALKSEAFDKKYSSLTGTPTIPAAQVNSDWNATSGISMILNKPILFDKAYTSLTGTPTTFTPSAHTHVINDITGLQNILNTITKYYTSTGVVTGNVKKWTTIVVPTTASGFTVDISSAGFTTILGVQAQAERNTTDASSVVQVGLKTKSTTSLSFNLTQTNTATVSVVGINVLSGLPLIFATNLNTILLHIEVTGI